MPPTWCPRAVSNTLLIGLVPRTVTVNFFRRRRNVVLALLSTFRPIAGAINIQIFVLIANWRDTYRYLGIASLALVIPVVLLMRRRPEDIGLQPDGASGTPQAQPSSLGRGSQAVAPPAEISWTVGKAIRTRTFWFIVATASVGTLASQQCGLQPGALPGGGSPG